MRKNLNAAVIITLILAILSVAVSANHNKNQRDKVEATEAISANTVATTDEELEEMRGMWVSYISLDMSGTNYSEKSFREKFAKIINTAKEYGCNSLFVHVRAFCDALYKSEFFPSSHILWGQQGASESYDALKIMCDECEKEKLQLHAWINPYRVTNDVSAFELSKDNPYTKDNTIGIEYDNVVYLNPANRNARELIVNGVKEIIENYNVDGIHFDDYFYPTSDESFDKADYNTYLKSCQSERDAMPLTAWRMNNVNMLVSEVYRTIKAYNPRIDFGISPQGNIQNDYFMGADVKSWAENVGYVDYICPQLYYSLENPALKFQAGLESWLEFDFHNDLKLYAGLAVYKAGTEADEGTWQNQSDILSKELEITRENGLDRYILYDYEAVISENAKAEMSSFKESI